MDSPAKAARDFLDAYADIESALTSRYSLRNTRGLGDIIRETERKDPLVRRYKNELVAFKELRNAISHNSYRGGAPIATPLPGTVRAAQQVRDEFIKPTVVLDAVLKQDLYVVGAQDDLRPHLQHMVDHAFSQVPVTGDDGHVALLTTNSIARWLAGVMDQDGGVLVVKGTVQDVLAHAEAHEKPAFVARDTPLAEALETMLKPHGPLALLITHSGKSTEKPLGMLVNADLPRMLSMLQVSLD